MSSHISTSSVVLFLDPITLETRQQAVLPPSSNSVVNIIDMSMNANLMTSYLVVVREKEILTISLFDFSVRMAAVSTSTITDVIRASTTSQSVKRVEYKDAMYLATEAAEILIFSAMKGEIV